MARQNAQARVAQVAVGALFVLVAACSLLVPLNGAWAHQPSSLGSSGLLVAEGGQDVAPIGQDPHSTGQNAAPSEQGAVDISLATFTLEQESFVYTGQPIKPVVSVELNGVRLGQDVDFTVTYSNNITAGKALVTVSGTGAYTGSYSLAFTISRQQLAKATIAKIAARTYAAKHFKPKPRVKLGTRTLKLGRDYTLSYQDNKNAGKATVVVKGAGNYEGQKTRRFTIRRASLSEAVVASIADKVYSGKLLKPKPRVTLGSRKLKLGRDYTLAYKRNRAIGQAQVVVRGIGNYKGKTIGTFNIVDWVSKLNIAKQTNQLIIVKASGVRANVSMHAKVNGVWNKVLSTSSGWIGYDGLGNAREGVAYTPRGVMYPDMAFGICGDPGCKMGYTQVDWSHYWCGDPNSDLYNQFVSTNDRSDFDLYASEHLAAMGYAYNYCLNMGWNADCAPYGGSAFFLHCSVFGPTGGCVGIPEWAMIGILRTIEPGCAIVIDTPKGVLRY